MSLQPFQLVYISSATRPLSDADLEDLLGEARIRNRAFDITGMLIYDDASFIQVLEGGEEVVERLYQRIARDPRHRDLEVLLRGRLQARQFAGWSMGFQRLDRIRPAGGGFTDFLARGCSPEVMVRDLAYRALRSFRDGHWRAPRALPCAVSGP
jgi:hypothetical protein